MEPDEPDDPDRVDGPDASCAAVRAAEPGGMCRDEVKVLLADVKRVRGCLDAIELRAARRARELAAVGACEPPESLLSGEGGRDSRGAATVGERDQVCDDLPDIETALEDGGLMAGDAWGFGPCCIDEGCPEAGPTRAAVVPAADGVSQPSFIMATMDHDDDRIIECATCPATGTTACGDCIVTHLLANDDGPIEYAPTARSEAIDAVSAGEGACDRGVGGLTDPPPSGSTGTGEPAVVARAVRLFAAAGLLDQPPRFVSPAEFAEGSPVPAGTGSPSGGSTR